jgi:Zn-dependent protease
MPVHEFAHAFSAYKLGDKSQKYMGRLTLNPFAHIDYIGALAILFVGFGWAKPVQVNPMYFKNPKVGMAVTSFAGPFANLITAFVCMLLYNFIGFINVFAQSAIIVYAASLFSYIAVINIGLAVFNLVPFPPLDGSKVLAVILPDRIYYKVMQYENYLYFILIILVATGVLSRPIGIVSDFVIILFNFITSLPFGGILSFF